MQQAILFLQAKGIQPTILGLKSGAIAGSAGASMPAEALISLLLSEEAERPLPDTLLIAGGDACGHQLLADPRVQQLIQKMVEAARPVGFLRPVSFPLIDLLSRKGADRLFWYQEKQKTAEFMGIFVQQIRPIMKVAQPGQSSPPI